MFCREKYQGFLSFVSGFSRVIYCVSKLTSWNAGSDCEQDSNIVSDNPGQIFKEFLMLAFLNYVSFTLNTCKTVAK